MLALACLNLPKNCKVITPACTFSTTLAPIIQLGYRPLFCDVNLTSYVPDIKDIIALLETNGETMFHDVKAIMVPNLIGNNQIGNS